MNKQMGRQIISERVKFARQRQGYSQRAFAKKIGMTSGNWSKTENGKQSISMDLLLRLNAVLNLDIRYYFGHLTFEDAKRTEGTAVEIAKLKVNISKTLFGADSIRIFGGGEGGSISVSFVVGEIELEDSR